MKRLIFKYALAVSSVSIVLKLVIFLTDKQFSEIGDYASYFIFLFILIGVYFGMRESRSISNNIQGFRENINTGCKIAAMNALIMGVFIYVYYSFIDPEYFIEKIRMTLSLMKQNDYTVGQMKEYYLNARLLFFAPDKVASFTLFGYLILGCLYAVISGFVLRKNQPPAGIILKTG